MRINTDVKLDFSDVLIRPKRSTLSSRQQVDLARTYTFLNSGQEWTGIPIVAANMAGVGTRSMAYALQDIHCITAFHKFIDVDNLHDEAEPLNHCNYAISCGGNEVDLKNLFNTLKKLPRTQFICMDVANGYQETFVESIKKVRAWFPDKTIIAGNVVTPEMTEQLLLSGADIVKVGIGSGSVCTTRIMTGVGYPQLSAVIECADAAHGLKGHIMSDGGCRTPGDIAKAFGAGSDFVMLGGMLAGHTESEGTLIDKNGSYYLDFYGMSSEQAQKKFYNGVNNYRAAEGKSVLIPWRGDVLNTMQEILGGLRSACTYVGAERLKDLSKCTTFIRVNNIYNDVFDKYNVGSSNGQDSRTLDKSTNSAD